MPAADLKTRIVAELDAVRARSLALLEPVPETDLLRQISPIMSPLVWDLAHVGNYEEQWLLGAVAGQRAAAHLDDLYDAFAHPRPERPSLPILRPPEARDYIADVRGRVLDALDRADLAPERPLLAGGFVYGMVAQHEHQHAETMLATLNLREGDHPIAHVVAPRAAAAPPAASEVLISGGRVTIGTSTDPWAYDNERPAHEVEVAPFHLDTTPVTNARYVAFIEAGGYDEPRWWSERGWAHRCEAGLIAPMGWSPDGAGGWTRTRFGMVDTVPPDQPVQHVCWFEADAFARWAGQRLPTEVEWEVAASIDTGGRKRRWPWGEAEPTSAHANLWPGSAGPAPVGSFPAGVSAHGVHGLIGDVWEWTSSGFEAYPGFRSFPYAEYSEVFLGGDFKVLRGGSWATSPVAIRSTFRNWDLPIRRQIFAGFRCARDA